MRSLIDRGFVLDDGVEVLLLPDIGSVILHGRISCLGGIEVTVEKELAILSGAGPTAKVKHRKFSYHANVAAGPNIFRYDSPVDHRPFYHKHCFDIFGDGSDHIQEIPDLEAVPTLGDVLDELEEWYWTHTDQIKALATGGDPHGIGTIRHRDP
jgi:hypothetical protein